jgi:CBS domain-containing protein
VTVRAIMTEDPLTLEAGEGLDVAHALMVSCRIRHLPVTRAGHLCGIISARDLAGIALDTTSAREVMHAPVETLDPDDSVQVAAGRLLARRFSSLPVLRAGRVVGIVTSTDLLRLLAERLTDEPVSRLMTPAPLMTVGPDESIAHALEQMQEGHIRHLPVVKEDELLGFVSDLDLLAARGQRSVREAMLARFLAVAPDTLAGDAARLLIRDRLDALPVTRDRRLAGVISAFDFVHQLLL